MPSKRELKTIQCPNCGRTLPPNVLKCHFCGGDLAFVGRPEEARQGPPLGTRDYKMERLYRGVAIFWMIDGLTTIMVSLGWLPDWASAIGGMLFSYVGLALTTGFLILVLGVGMFLKVPLARWLVGAFCWFRVVTGVLGIGIVLRSGDFDMTRHNIYVLAVLNFIDTAFAAFQIWLLNVTDYEVLN